LTEGRFEILRFCSVTDAKEYAPSQEDSPLLASFSSKHFVNHLLVAPSTGCRLGTRSAFRRDKAFPRVSVFSIIAPKRALVNILR
jgi:hypothetical protein